MTVIDIPAVEISKGPVQEPSQALLAAGSNDQADVKAGKETPRGVVPLGALSLIAGGAVGIVVYGALGLGIAAIFSESARQFWSDDWVWVLAGFALCGLLIICGRLLEEWLHYAPEETTHKVFALVAILTITASIMGLIAFGSTQYLSLAAQLIIIPVAALLPAVTYYLFLTTRRPSILNEFIANLGRLGLLERNVAPTNASRIGQDEPRDKPRDESDAERSARVESYFQRFESIYGALRFETSADRITRSRFVAHLIESVEKIKSGDKPTTPCPLPQATTSFGDIFKPNLIVPIGLVTVLVTLGWVLVLQPDFKMAEMAVADVTPKRTALNFAFLGAYFFGLQMLFRRFVRRDLSPNAYFAFANRIILAVIGVWLVVAVYSAFPGQSQVSATAPESAKMSAAPESGPPKAAAMEGNAPADTGKVVAPTADAAKKVETSSLATMIRVEALPYHAELILLLAFTIGVFPRIVWQFLSAGVTKLLRVNLVLPSVEAMQPLNKLDGLTVWHETRLEEEDVENVPNMASVDIVELMLYTKIPMERLVSWIDQAILLTVLGHGEAGDKTRENLRKLGLRTATQVCEVSGIRGEALSTALGDRDHMDALVAALQKEANFDRVRAWREV